MITISTWITKIAWGDIAEIRWESMKLMKLFRMKVSITEPSIDSMTLALCVWSDLCSIRVSCQSVKILSSLRFQFAGVVRPVCLPIQTFAEMKAGDSAYVVGFGRTLYSKMSSIKQKLRLPVYDHAKCRIKFATKNVDITSDQICAGGEFSKDACDGGETMR